MRFKNKIYFILSILFIMNSCASSAQVGYTYSTKSKKAIKLYEEALTVPNRFMNKKTGGPDYETAIAMLKDALGKDDNFVEAHQLIGEFYRLSGEPKEAVVHYKKALAIRPHENLNGQLYIDIGDLQMKNLEYDDAIRYFDLVLQGNNRSTPQNVINTAVWLKENALFAKESRKNPESIKPINVGKGINSVHPEYFPTLTVDGKTMLFTREMPDERFAPRGQEDFFISNLTEDNVWGASTPMPKNINTSRNEGAPTFSADGRTLIFVACADESGSYGRGRQGKGSCDLFVTYREGENWTDPINLPGNVNTFTWESQPSLSADGKTLYFVRKVGGRGSQDTDIFVSELQEDGTWGTPEPLPNVINTPRRESSVLIHPDGQTLYFASDGHIGLGGTDLYMSRKDPLGNWSKPINLGYPINTENNENSLLVDPDGKVAYFASDRPGGVGDLDIYHFELPKRFRPIPTTYFDGLVFDALTKKPLKGKFELIDLGTGKQVITSEADGTDGKFLLALPTKKEYALNVSFPGYAFFSKNFNMIDSDEAVHMDVPMIPLNSDQPILLANIFFDLSQSTLRKESFVELNKLRDFLKENGAIKIEIGGHTDTRGDAKLNQQLSEDRAKSVYDFLVKEGIATDRLSYKGYGATHPLISDADIGKMGTDTEKEQAHQQNRRTEYKIIK